MDGLDGSPCGPLADSEAPGPDAVRSQLDRVLGSTDFAPSARMTSFLRYVVEETLEGRAERLKEYTIATEVFGRDESFDPQTNTIVRVEAGRLRRRIERYYLTTGRGDPVRIDLPKGKYVPLFRAAATVEEIGTAGPEQDAAGPSAQTGAVPQTARGPDTDEAALPSGPSIAVLPFDNLSGDPEQAFFADGISEEIINALTRFPDLRVIARHSTFKYKGQRVDVRDVGRDLAVRYVLEGSIRKGGNMVRVTAQLIEAADGTHLFSETYDRDLSARNILEVQDDISERIVAAVGQPYGVIARAGTRRSRRKKVEHLDAYDAVLRFYDYWINGSAESHASVRAALEHAVELDPGYASAWAALAETYLNELIFSFNPRADSNPLDRALEAAQKAVVLDPESSMAYHMLSNTHFHRAELDEFRAAAARAIALNPNHADMLADVGVRLCCVGEWDRGMELAEKAIFLSPTHPGWFHGAPTLDHYNKGKFEDALAEAKQVQTAGLSWNFVLVAMCCGQLGREEEARAACGKLVELVPDFGENAWFYLSAWNFPLSFANKIADGLRKAGLEIPSPPET